MAAVREWWWRWRSCVELPGASLCAALVAIGAGHVPSVPIAWPPDEAPSVFAQANQFALLGSTMTAVDEREPVEGIDVPRTRLEFETLFASEAACRAYLERVRWRDGFVCPNQDCGGRQAWVTARGLHRCAACGRQTSATAGTIFAGTRKPLRAWFEVLWRIAGKDGVSAMAVETALGLGSYQTAWVWLHKVRRAMALVAPERLTGIVELGVISLPQFSTIRGRNAARRGDFLADIDEHSANFRRCLPIAPGFRD